MASYSDDFNRADGAPGSDWVVPGTLFAVSSNKLAHDASGSDGLAVFQPAAATADQEASFDFVADGNSGHYLAIWVRLGSPTSTTANATGYLFFCNNTGSDAGIVKLVAGTPTDLVSGDGVVSLTNGVTYRIALRAEGTTLTASIDSTTVCTVTDSSIASGAYAGLSSGNAVFTADNWTFGDLTAPPAPADYGWYTAQSWTGRALLESGNLPWGARDVPSAGPTFVCIVHLGLSGVVATGSDRAAASSVPIAMGAQATGSHAATASATASAAATAAAAGSHDATASATASAGASTAATGSHDASTTSTAPAGATAAATAVPARTITAPAAVGVTAQAAITASSDFAAQAIAAIAATASATTGHDAASTVQVPAATTTTATSTTTRAVTATAPATATSSATATHTATTGSTIPAAPAARADVSHDTAATATIPAGTGALATAARTVAAAVTVTAGAVSGAVAAVARAITSTIAAGIHAITRATSGAASGPVRLDVTVAPAVVLTVTTRPAATLTVSCTPAVTLDIDTEPAAALAVTTAPAVELTTSLWPTGAS